jgi:hypothetical protein
MDEIFRQRLIDLYKMVVARSDITAALEACDLLLKEVRDFLEDYKHGKYTPLLNAIIICYARPFTNNKPFGPLDKKWSIFADTKQQDIHKDLINYRHKMIAHSDFNVRKVIIFPKNVAMDDDGKYKSPRVSVSVSIKGLTLEYIENVRAVCFHVGSRLNTEIDVELESLFGDDSVPKEKIDLGEILGLP